MSDPVKAVTDTTLPWGQEKKTQTTTETTAPADDGGAATQTTTASTSGSYQDSYQPAPMQSRLRDLLAELAREPEPTALGRLRFTSVVADEGPRAAEGPLLTAAEIIAHAAKSMVAQATHSRESVLALVDSGSLASGSSSRPAPDPTLQ